MAGQGQRWAGRITISFCCLVVLLAWGRLNAVGSAQAAVRRLAAEADVRPWSGYWWPLATGGLAYGYRGRPSPVEKYDLYVSGTYPGAAYYAAVDPDNPSHWYDSGAENWVGFCHGWVNASILEPEPDRGSVINGITFRVGDKKGLLTGCHAWDERILANCQSKPALFHGYLLEYLYAKKEIIGADLDQSREFWSYPIFAFAMDITPGETSDQVHCRIRYANDLVDPDYVGTDVRRMELKYTLAKDAAGNYTGEGSWAPGMGHPEWVWVPVGINPDKLFVDYAKVQEITRSPSEDDPDEHRLLPGHHVLALNPGESRYYVGRPGSGDRFECRLALSGHPYQHDQAAYSLELNGQVVKQGIIDETVVPRLEMTGTEGEAGSYTLRVRALPENFSMVSAHLLVDVKAADCRWFYGVATRPDWIGCGAVLADSADTGKAWLETVDGHERPTGLGASSTPEYGRGGGWVTVVDNREFHYDRLAGDPPKAVKLVSDSPASGLFITGSLLRLRGTSARQRPGRQKVIPWLSRFFGREEAEVFVHNPQDQEGSVTFRYYRADGRPGKEAARTLAAHSIADYEPGSCPDQAGRDGWALIDSDVPIQGAVLFREGPRIGDSLPLLDLASEGVVPYLVVEQGWRTVLRFYNPGATVLPITLRAVLPGRKTVDCQVDVAPHARQETVLKGALWKVSDHELAQGWLRVLAPSPFAGSIGYRYLDEAQASLPLYSLGPEAALRALSPIAIHDGWWTGLVLLNPDQSSREVILALYDSKGNSILKPRPFEIDPQSRRVVNLADLVSDPERLKKVELLRLGQAGGIKALALYGAFYGTSHLAARSW